MICVWLFFTFLFLLILCWLFSSVLSQAFAPPQLRFKVHPIERKVWNTIEKKIAQHLEGIEPMSSLLWGMCSTTVLHSRCPAFILFLNFIPDRRRLHAGLRIVHDGAAHPLPGRGPIHPRARSLQDPSLWRHPRRVQRVLAARRLQPQGRTIINPSLYNTSLSMF